MNDKKLKSYDSEYVVDYLIKKNVIDKAMFDAINENINLGFDYLESYINIPKFSYCS